MKVDYDKDANFFEDQDVLRQDGCTAWGNPWGRSADDRDRRALAAKGWTKATNEGAADAVVVLHGATQVKKDLNTFYSGMGMGGYGYRYGGFGGGTAHTSVSEYTVGTLVVDIFDAKSKNLLFRGTATDELSDKPEKNQKKLAKASDKMFKDFPPGSAKK